MKDLPILCDEMAGKIQHRKISREAKPTSNFTVLQSDLPFLKRDIVDIIVDNARELWKGKLNRLGGWGEGAVWPFSCCILLLYSTNLIPAPRKGMNNSHFSTWEQGD